MSSICFVPDLVPRVSVVSETLRKYLLLPLIWTWQASYVAAWLCQNLCPYNQMHATSTLDVFTDCATQYQHYFFAATHIRNPTMWSILYAGGIPRRNKCTTFSLFTSILYTSSILGRNHVCLFFQHFAYVLCPTSYKNKWYNLSTASTCGKKHQTKSVALRIPGHRDPHQLFDVCLDGMVILSAEKCHHFVVAKIWSRKKKRQWHNHNSDTCCTVHKHRPFFMTPVPVMLQRIVTIWFRIFCPSHQDSLPTSINEFITLFFTDIIDKILHHLGWLNDITVICN